PTRRSSSFSDGGRSSTGPCLGSRRAGARMRAEVTGIARLLLHWFDRHAGAVQALSSIAALVVTTVLVGITYQYVRLTRKLAVAAEAQVANSLAEREGRRRALLAAIGDLRRRVSELPTSLQSHPLNTLGRAVLWTPEQLNDLRH